MFPDPDEFTPAENIEALDNLKDHGNSDPPNDLDAVKGIDSSQRCFAKEINNEINNETSKEINDEISRKEDESEEITLLDADNKIGEQKNGSFWTENLQKNCRDVSANGEMEGDIDNEDDSQEITFLEPEEKLDNKKDRTDQTGRTDQTDLKDQNGFDWGFDSEKNSAFDFSDDKISTGESSEEDDDLGEIPLLETDTQSDWTKRFSDSDGKTDSHHTGSNDGEIDLATIEFRCPFCTSKLTVSQSLAGQRYLCPYCFHKIPVPEQSSLPLEETDPSLIYSVDSSSDEWQKKQDDFISVLCPRCRSIIAVSKSSHDKTIHCPDCEKEIDVEENLLDKYRELTGQTKTSSVEQQQERETYEITDQWTPETAEKEAAAQDDSFPVYCPVCHTLQYARPEQIGCTVQCPDCYFEFKVIRTREAPKAGRTAPLEYEGGDSYALQGENVSDSTEKENVRVVCERCGTIVYQPVSKIGQMSRCPDCEHETRIRPMTEEKRREQEKIQPRETGVYGVQQESAPPAIAGENGENGDRRVAPVIAASFTTPPPSPAPSEYDYVPMFRRSGNSSFDNSMKKELKEGFLPPYQKTTENNIPPIQSSSSPSMPFSSPQFSSSAPTDSSASQRVRSSDGNRPMFTGRQFDGYHHDARSNSESAPPVIGSQTESSERASWPYLEGDPDKKDPSEHLASSETRRKKGFEDRDDGKILVRRGDQIVYVTASPPKNAIFNHPFRILNDSVLWIKSLPLIFGGLLIAFLIYRIIFPNIFVKTTESGATVQGSASAGVSLILIPTLAVIFLTGVFWFGKMSQFMISIIQAGGSGARRVGEWLEEDFTGGFVQGLWLLGIVLLSCIPSGIVSSLLKMQLPDLPWQVHSALGIVIFSLVFPGIFLMTWQSGGGASIRIVLGSFFHCFGSWLGFQIQILLLAGIPLIAAVLWGDGAFGMILWLIALVMIPPVYSVLLGRLAWIIEDNVKKREED